MRNKLLVIIGAVLTLPFVYTIFSQPFVYTSIENWQQGPRGYWSYQFINSYPIEQAYYIQMFLVLMCIIGIILAINGYFKNNSQRDKALTVIIPFLVGIFLFAVLYNTSHFELEMYMDWYAPLYLIYLYIIFASKKFAPTLLMSFMAMLLSTIVLYFVGLSLAEFLYRSSSNQGLLAFGPEFGLIVNYIVAIIIGIIIYFLAYILRVVKK